MSPLRPIEREIEFWIDVLGLFSDDRTLAPLIGAILLEQNEGGVQGSRSVTLGSIAPIRGGDVVSWPTPVAGPARRPRSPPKCYRAERKAIENQSSIAIVVGLE